MPVRIVNHRNEVKKAINNALTTALEGVGVFVASEAADELENSPRRVDTGTLKTASLMKWMRMKKPCMQV